MDSNDNKRELAIKLRKNGKTYSEIQECIKVSKSTLSLWLSDIKLLSRYSNRIINKKVRGALKGAVSKRKERIDRSVFIESESIKDIKSVSDRELWLIGIALYWAEGSKSKEYNPSEGVRFTNSDPRMICLFIRWARICLNLNMDRITLSLYIHKSHKHRLAEIITHWAQKTDFPESHFIRVYFKKNKKSRRKRKNNEILYNGLIRVNITKSTEINRKISGWIKGIVTNCGVV